MANGIVFITRPGKKAQIPVYVRVRYDGKDFMAKVPKVTTTAETWPNGRNAQFQIRAFYPVLGKIFSALSAFVEKGDFSKDKMNDTIAALVFGDSREKARKEVMELKEERKKLSFVEYFENFVNDLETGKREWVLVDNL